MKIKLLFAGALACLTVSASLTSAATVAYWRFEDGTAGTDVNHIAVDGNTFSPDILDVSGNGNHLSTWITGGCCGYQYRDDVAGPVVLRTGAANTLSVKNTGSGPGMFTNALVSNPTGVNIDTMMPTAFTVEASWKMENGGYRTVVGRDAQNISTSNAAEPAVMLQARPDNSVGVRFTDAAGVTHEAYSPAGYIQGFDFATDPDGLLSDWYHLAGVSDGTTLKLYVNNALVTSTPIVSADPRLSNGTTNGSTADGGDWNPGAWTVGRGLWGGGHTDRAYGFIDEVRISDNALGQQDMLYHAELALEVNKTTGQISIKNTSASSVNIDFYQINSAGGALSTTGWNSLDDQNFDAVDGTDAGTVAGNSPGEGWDQAGGSNANQLVEQFLRSVGSTIAPNQTLNLGSAYNTSIFGSNNGDLEFTFGYNGGILAGGSITYVGGGSQPGDFDGDGDVDGRDFLAWQRNPSVGSLSDWKNNYGSGSLTAAVAVPEPATGLLFVALGTLLVARRSRAC
jgi:hypothetical protein